MTQLTELTAEQLKEYSEKLKVAESEMVRKIKANEDFSNDMQGCLLLKESIRCAANMLIEKSINP